MADHSPTPWRIDEEYGTIVDANNTPVADSYVYTACPDDPAGMQDSDMRRIVACVNFCQHCPTEALEGLLDEKIGAMTVLQWLRQMQHVPASEEYDACIQCSHIGPYHAEDCLLGKAVSLMPARRP